MSFKPRNPRCPPAFELERVVAKETVPEVSEHLATCSECREHVATLSQAALEFSRTHPVSKALRAPARTQAPQRPRFWIPLAGLSAVAATLVAFVFLNEPPPGITLKGSLLSIAVKRGEDVHLLSGNESLRAQDALRFRLSAPSAGYAVVLEKDAQGKVTVVAPFEATAPQPVQAGVSVLPDSAILDSSPGTLSYLAVFSPKAFDLISLVRQLQEGASPSCDTCILQTSTFEKLP